MAEKIATIQLVNGVVSWFDSENNIYLSVYLKQRADIYDDMILYSIREGLRANYIKVIEGSIPNINSNQEIISIKEIETLINKKIKEQLNKPNIDLSGYSKIGHTHLASQVLFQDGLTFQEKYDKGAFIGPKGLTGDKGDIGLQGIGINNIYMNNNHIYTELNDENKTIIDVGEIQIDTSIIIEDLNQKINDLNTEIKYLRDELKDINKFGDYYWKDIDIIQTKGSSILDISNTKFINDSNNNIDDFWEAYNLGKYELYALRLSDMRDYENYYNTLIPLENSSQVEGSELSCLSQSLLNNSWKFENNQIILKQSTTTPIVFTIIKRL